MIVQGLTDEGIKIHVMCKYTNHLNEIFTGIVEQSINTESTLKAQKCLLSVKFNKSIITELYP